MSEAAELPRPVCLALVLCEHVIQDQRTKNLTLVNIFNMVSTRFPEKRTPKHPRLAVFVSLTNGRGKSQGKLIITDALGNEVFHGEGPIAFPDPLAVVEMTFDIRSLPLPCEGQYIIHFWCNEDLLQQRHFQVKRIDGEGD